MGYLGSSWVVTKRWVSVKLLGNREKAHKIKIAGVRMHLRLDLAESPEFIEGNQRPSGYETFQVILITCYEMGYYEDR